MSASKISTASTLVSVLFFVTACSTGEELRGDIANIQFGSSKASVLATLGTPAAVNTTNILGVEIQGLVFRRGATACELGMFADRVVSRSCRSLPV